MGASPPPTARAGKLAHSAGRLRLGDLAGISLAGLFFSLPLLVSGGSAPALTNGWILAPMLWPLALPGAFILRWMGWYESRGLSLLPDGLRVAGESGAREIPFAQITGAREEILRLPRWLAGAPLLAIALATPCL